MKPRWSLRTAEVVVGLGLLAVAGLVMAEGVRLGPGWEDDHGPQPGFFPFSLAVLLAVGALAALIQAVRAGSPRPFFEERQEVVDLLRVGVPMMAAVVSIVVLGFYIMTFAYLAFFAWWYGRYRWYSAIVSGLVTAWILYLGLERGFRIPLPRSAWYPSLLPF